jgi:hypothetical protein
MHAFLYRLANKGVSGEMWRLIDALYQRALPGCALEAASSSLCLCIAECRQGAPCNLSFMRPLLIVFLSLSKPSVPTRIRGGQAPMALQAYADNQAAASSTPIGLQRILDAMKRYGDTWGCYANTDKTNILLVGPSAAAVEDRRHASHWGSFSLTVVDQVRYKGI